MDHYSKFKSECRANAIKQKLDTRLIAARDQFLNQSFIHNYSYNFEFMGRPIIQYPQDMVAMQELIWSVKPDLIIETGIAHGGSLIMNAAMLALLDTVEAEIASTTLRKVVGIDIDIRAHNRLAIESHPMASRIQMIEGSSIDPNVIDQVHSLAREFDTIMVCLDSNHTHDHVLAELNAFGSLVTVGSYCVVFDTVVEDLPNELFPERPWCRGNNPATAVEEFLKSTTEFVVDQEIHEKLLISVAPGGYLKKVK